MRLFALTCLAMAALAANSVLARLGIAWAGTDPGVFAFVRTFSGALALLVLVAWRVRPVKVEAGWGGAVTLALYMGAFALALLRIDAGSGTLILFGVVQVTMFAGAVFGRDAIPPQRWLGAAISLAGLVYLVWPGAGARLSVSGAMLMAVAGLAWGLYSLIGRQAADPVAATARNFARAVPLTLPLLAFGQGASVAGLVCAVLSGVVTSALGYTLWYRLLPDLGATRAAVAQLSVPVLAALGGALILSEGITLRLVLAGALVLGGIAVSLLPRRVRGRAGQ